jgi:hypothetical protein
MWGAGEKTFSVEITSAAMPASSVDAVRECDESRPAEPPEKISAALIVSGRIRRDKESRAVIN